MTQYSLFETPPPDWLRIEYSARARKSWSFKWTRARTWLGLRSLRSKGQGVLTVPSYFQEPQLAVALPLFYQWAELSTQRNTQVNRQARQALEQQIWSLVNAHKGDLGLKLTQKTGQIPPTQAAGDFHNLQEHFNWINQHYFQGQLQAQIGWSARIGGQSFHTIRRDKSGAQVHWISISRGYDFANCPPEALRGVIYHECLHIAVPPQIINGRRVVHGREFRQREKQYEHYAAWIKWHQEVLPRNVRALHKAQKSQKAKR